MNKHNETVNKPKTAKCTVMAKIFANEVTQIYWHNFVRFPNHNEDFYQT